MFKKQTNDYISLLIDWSILMNKASYTDEEENAIADPLEDAFYSFDEEGITANQVSHDLNILERFEGVSKYKSSIPSTLEAAMRAYHRGDLRASLAHGREIVGGEDMLLRQGLILDCYRRLMNDEDLYARVRALCPNPEKAELAFLTFLGGSC